MVCDIQGCHAGATGTCKAKPSTCPGSWAPVCGCNGATYANDCYRLQAGVPLQHQGACATAPPDAFVWPDLPPPLDAGPGTCGPFPGGQCPWNMVCNIQSCYSGAAGVCVAKPYSCPTIWKPVCGCDGKTYDNDCVRLMSGVALKHTGACLVVTPDAFVWPDLPLPPPPLDGGPSVCGPWPGGQCPWSMVCDIHSCYPGAAGTCLPTPGACPKLWAPVCGCDGLTYSNDCFRLQAGVARDHTGACATPTKDSGPFVDAPATCFAGGCGPAMVCDITGCGNVGGVCVPQPKSCPFPWDPVCGCNGLTYVNDCNRLLVGVALKHKGMCTSTLDAGPYID
jgi:hypothetical protein